MKFAKVTITPPLVEGQTKNFRLAYREKVSNVVKFYEESDDTKVEKSKFENLEVSYNDSEAYNITRIRVCQEFDTIFENFRQQLTDSSKESENLGDSLAVGLCQEAFEILDNVEKDIIKELPIQASNS